MVNYEVERKWKVDKRIYSYATAGLAKVKVRIEQTKLSSEKGGYTRIRKITERNRANEYYLTVKLATANPTVRVEYEAAISEKEYLRMVAAANATGIETVMKYRTIMNVEGTEVVVDDYDTGNNFVLVEVEFDSLKKAERFTPPQWFGKEVTGKVSFLDFTK